MAQRRGMQGVVKVRFTILTNGKVGNISVSGPKVFHRSARAAVKGAFPISVKNAPFALPETITLPIHYKQH
jgi:protein TonB